MSQRTPLWSDGWDRDLEAPEAPTDPRADHPAPAAPAAASRPALHSAVPVVAALLVVGAAGAGIAASRAGRHHPPTVSVVAAAPPTATPAQPSVPQLSTTAPHTGGHGADALGLKLAAAPGHGVLVAGVAPGSPVTDVGVDAGQVLQSINGRAVSTPAQAEAILDGLPLGTAVTLQLTQGGAQITAQLQEPGIP